MGYALIVGAQGILIKLAFKSVTWPAFLVPIAAMYTCLMAYFLITGQIKFPQTPGRWILWVTLAGASAAVSFPLINVALQRAPASQVIPITAAYPIVTAILSIIFLAEQPTALRVIGTLLIVVGVVLLAR